MSRIEELIQKLCPNGVEWKELGEVCQNIVTGKLNANAGVIDGKYPFFTCDEKPLSINSYAFDTYAILISGNGSKVGHVNIYEGKFNAYQRTYVLYKFINNIDIKFIYHYFKFNLRKYINLHSKKGSVPYITLPTLKNLKLPIPPIEIQKEIVYILDSFTNLTENLIENLTARRKQYEFYRDSLLTFGDDVEWKELGVLAEIKTGNKPQNISEQNGKYEYVNAGRLNSGFVNDYNTDGDVVTTPSRGQGGIGFVGYQKNKFWLGSLCYGIKAYDTKKILNKYLYYYISSNSIDIFKIKNEGGVPSVNKISLEKILIRVPPLEVQERIVSILDKFDSLCNDITQGLPLEIESRKKQYEYYRDKLLTFKDVSEHVGV